MSVKVVNLEKSYGSQKVLNGISFEVQKSQILGFLGPNGAGKTTTMRIITGSLIPDNGSVYVSGFNIFENEIEAKRRVGYLAEHNPLYTDMYIREFLDFIASVYQIGNKNKRINELIEITGLGKEQNKKIRQLSKGYRQRVGLAQVLIHDPEVLILDEPTSGLDPNQLREIRSVIRETGKNKTVILSTHIMQEVQALCDRVIVINKGVIVADDKLSNLMDKNRPSVIEVEFETEVTVEKLKTIPGVTEVLQTGANKYRLMGADGTDLRAVIFQFTNENKISLLGLRKEEASLELIFRELTQEVATHP